ncbi:TonB-dependent receptor [Aquimarina gracilis]|uniref:TonB-dependent receptor n=1 Tax=Aquimarina gracilis TaxID=874422 RepID=UPI002B493F6C|nr:TonB-dependent receptor [Aquimarina gracilis]
MFFVFGSYSQTSSQKIPLSNLITEIESRFELKFTYADDTIEGVFIVPINQDWSLDQIIEFLEEETKLVFNKLANNFVAIYKRKASFFICGNLKDRTGSFLLEGATIQAKESSTISDREGNFRLKVSSPKETIIIGHLGYRTVYRLADSFKSNDCATIYMDPKTETLSEVLISNYITKGIGKTTDGSFQIDYDNFGILPGLIETDVLQTIQALPGIQSADETVSNLNIRGGTHDQNLILWDDIKLYQSGHFFGLISAINPLITKKATLIKNGTNPEFTDGVSGTIIMNTDNKVNDDFKMSIGTNMINADVFSDIPIGKKSSLQLTARKSIRDLVKTPTYSQYFDRISQDSEVEDQRELTSDIGFDFYDVNLRLNYDLSSNDKLRINFLGISNELVFTENAIINANLQSRQSSLVQNSIAGGVWYQRNWNNKLKTVLQAYETDYRLKSINANLQQEQRFLQENKVSETGIKLKGYYDIAKTVTLLGGYQFIETGVSNLNDVDVPLFIEKRERVIRTHSLFSQVYFRPIKKTSLNAGFRYNYNEKFNSHIIEPRLSFNQQLLKHFNLEVLAEFKHQNTTQIINFQNDFLGIEKRRWILANDEDIPVVKSQQVSTGITYNRKGWLINAEGYLKKVKGITARSQGFQNQYEFVRGIGDYMVKGLDFLLNKRFKDISAWMSYSFVDNQYIFDSFEEQEFPNNVRIRHAVTLGSSYAFNNVKLAAGLNWRSGLPTTRPLQENPVIDDGINYQNANSSRLDEYFRFDVSATYDFTISKGIKAQTGLSIWNLTNRENIINTFYEVDQQSVPREEIEFSLGITPNATFRMSF